MAFNWKYIVCFLLVLALTGLFFPVYAQFLLKEREQRFKGNSDAISIIKRTKDGGFITGGSAPADPIGASGKETKQLDFLVIRRDSAGVVLWEKKYGGFGFEDLSEILPLPDGGFLLCGDVTNREIQMYHLYDKHKPGTGSMDYYVVRIDKNGNMLWDKTFGSPAHDRLRLALALPDGGFLVGGNSLETKKRDQSDPLYYTDAEYDMKSTYRIFRLDAAGNQLWTRRYAGSDAATLNAVHPLPGGGFLLAGWSNSGIGDDRTVPKSENQDYWVLKVDANGKKVWDKAYAISVNDYVQQITPLADGNILISGSFNALKIDPDGKLLWERSYLQPGKHYDKFFQAVPTPDGGFLLGGYAVSEKTIPDTKVKNPEKDFDFYVLKADKAGRPVWSQKLGGGKTEALQLLIPLPDNTWLLGGTTNSGKGFDIGLPPKGNRDIWLLKVKENTGPALYSEVRAAAICAGNSFAVPFKTNRPFQAGNMFVAQLSDASGSFAKPLEIGRLQAASADSIMVTIPGYISAGDNYQLRIIATNPSITGAGNQARIRILPSTLKAELESFGPGHMLLKPSGGLPPYQPAANQDPYRPNPENKIYSISNLGAGDHILRVRDDAGCEVVIPVTVYPLKQCGEEISSGKAMYTMVLHQLTGKTGNVKISYSFPDEPGVLEAYMNGKPVATTGKAVKGSGAISFAYKPVAGEDKLYIKVSGKSSTSKWQYKVICPGS